MKRGNMKLGTKLYGGFVGVVLIFLLLVGSNINTMIRMGKLQDIGGAAAKDALVIKGSQTDLEKIYGMVGDAVINRDFKKMKEKLVGAKEDVNQDIEKIKKMVETEREKELAGNIADGYGKYFSLLENDLCPQLEKGAALEEVAKVDAQVDAVVSSLHKNMDDFGKSIEGESELRDKEFDELRDSSIRMAIILVLAGVVLAVLCAVFITRGATVSLKQVIAGLTDGAQQIAAAAQQVSSSSQQLAEGTSEQASSLEETSSSLEEMSSMTKQNAGHATQARAMMAEANQVVEKVNRHMTDMAAAVGEITRSSEETGKIIKTIDEIAFQTNLLALNAAVEAARAGEAGAGFAVVADEVRNLAMRAADAAKNTSNLIENTIKAVHNGKQLTESTQEAFRENAEISRKVGQLVDEIAQASEEQSRGISQVNVAVGEMDKVTQSAAASAEESAAAAEQLNAQAEQMKVYVHNLVSVVNGSANGQVSFSSSLAVCADGGSHRAPAFSHKSPAVPDRKQARQAVGKGKAFKEVVRPEEMIPLRQNDFMDF